MAWNFTKPFAYQSREEINLIQIQTVKKGINARMVNKNIHIRATIECYGKLHLDHCTIYYNEPDMGGVIFLAKGANLIMTDCVIFCCGERRKYLVHADSDNSIAIQRCTFIDCAYFLKGRKVKTFEMSNCIMNNCFVQFMELECTGSKDAPNRVFRQNLFFSDEFPEMYWEIEEDMDPKIMIRIDSTESFPFQDNIFVEKGTFKIPRKRNSDRTRFNVIDYYIYCTKGKFENITCIELKGGFRGQEFTNSYFFDCTEVVETSLEKPALVTNCVFECGTSLLFLSAGTKVTHCQFIRCEDALIRPLSDKDNPYELDHCQFVNIKLDNDYMLETDRNWEKNKIPTRIKNCTFSGIQAYENYIIELVWWGKAIRHSVSVEDCEFRDCTTLRNNRKLFNDNLGDNWTQIILHKIVNRIKIKNCKGLNNVNAENERSNIACIIATDKGKNIGSTFRVSNHVDLDLEDFVGF